MKEALSYDDVLLVPQYSEIESRSAISLESQLGKSLKFNTPVIASPMDTVSGYQMALTLSKLGGVAIIHRYNTIEEQVSIVSAVKREGERVGAAIGTTGDYMARVSALEAAGVDFVCVDVAHGDHIMVKQAINAIKEKYGSSLHIMAGNVATKQAFQRLEAWGADSIRVGIGGGCFLPDTQIRTKEGLKNIQEVKIGDEVYTHDGSLKQVINTISFNKSEEIVSIDGIRCTKNHEFYVVEKKDAEFINEQNIHNYAKWVEAWELDIQKHLLVELE